MKHYSNPPFKNNQSLQQLQIIGSNISEDSQVIHSRNYLIFVNYLFFRFLKKIPIISFYEDWQCFKPYIHIPNPYDSDQSVLALDCLHNDTSQMTEEYV